MKRLLAGLLLIGIAGCGNSGEPGNSTQELWDKYDSSFESLSRRVSGELKTKEEIAAALSDAQRCLSTLQQIKNENRNATKPTSPERGKGVDTLIEDTNVFVGSLESQLKMLEFINR